MIFNFRGLQITIIVRVKNQKFTFVIKLLNIWNFFKSCFEPPVNNLININNIVMLQQDSYSVKILKPNPYFRVF